MDLDALQIQIFVSLVLVLGALFVALVCDFLKGNNEVLREHTIELMVRQEERGTKEAQPAAPPAAPDVRERERMSTPLLAAPGGQKPPFVQGRPTAPPPQVTTAEPPQTERPQERITARTTSEPKEKAKEKTNEKERDGIGPTPKSPTVEATPIVSRPPVFAEPPIPPSYVPDFPKLSETAEAKPKRVHGSSSAGSKVTSIDLLERSRAAAEIPRPPIILGEPPSATEPAVVKEAAKEPPAPKVIIEEQVPETKLAEVKPSVGLEAAEVIPEPAAATFQKALPEEPDAAELPQMPPELPVSEEADGQEPAAAKLPEPVAKIEVAAEPETIERPVVHELEVAPDEPLVAESKAPEPELPTQAAELLISPTVQAEPVPPKVEATESPAPDAFVEVTSAEVAAIEETTTAVAPVVEEALSFGAILSDASSQLDAPDLATAPPAVEEPAENAPVAEATAAEQESPAAPEPEMLVLPTGLQGTPVLEQGLESKKPFRGTVIAVGFSRGKARQGSGRSQDPQETSRAVEKLIESLLGNRDTAFRSGEDEYLIALPDELGPKGQRRLQFVSESLWDYQIRSVGVSSILFYWGSSEGHSELFSAIVNSAKERMYQTKRTRERPPSEIHHYRMNVVRS